jgi:carotenoid cleavage dioxygenase-like enzyme
VSDAGHKEGSEAGGHPADGQAMKHVVKFDTDEKGVALTNVYIGLDGMRQLNNPSAVKVTIEAYEA